MEYAFGRVNVCLRPTCLNVLLQIIKWRERMGVEPTGDTINASRRS